LYFRKDKWLIPAIIAAFAFLLSPHLFIFIFSGFTHPWVYFGWQAGFFSLCWDLVSFPFLLFMAWLTSRFRASKMQNTDDLSDTGNQPVSK
jgi:membrane protein implicated in regulation of membrane protease activity